MHNLQQLLILKSSVETRYTCKPLDNEYIEYADELFLFKETAQPVVSKKLPTSANRVCLNGFQIFKIGSDAV